MTSCQTCGGYGMHHDPVAHDAEPEERYGHDCEHTSLEHGADGCNVPGCLCAFMSWAEDDYDEPSMTAAPTGPAWVGTVLETCIRDVALGRIASHSSVTDEMVAEWRRLNPGRA